MRDTAAMSLHITAVTLGVRDVARARAFYCDALGARPASASNEHIVFMQAGGAVLALYGRAALAEDATVSPEGAGFSGVTLAHNVGSRAEVDALMRAVERAGGRVVKAPAEVFWGGYSGYFADPDGHLWEVAHNPFWALDEAGNTRVAT